MPLDAVLSAVADPTRRAILSQLAHGSACVTEIAAPFPMSLAAVSKHVKVLEGAGLVRRTQEGRVHTITLNAAPLREVATWASEYERFWTQRLDRLEAFFAAKALPTASSKTTRVARTPRARARTPPRNARRRP